MMQVSDQISKRVSGIHATRRFRTHCIPYIRNNLSRLTTVKTVDPSIAHRHQGDFYGLLSYLGVPTNKHFLTLIINKMVHPSDYDGETIAVRVLRENATKPIQTLLR